MSSILKVILCCIFLLNAFTFAQRARYIYSGPDGCKEDTCDCTTEISKENDEQGNPTVTVHHLSCESYDEPLKSYYSKKVFTRPMKKLIGKVKSGYAQFKSKVQSEADKYSKLSAQASKKMADTYEDIKTFTLKTSERVKDKLAAVRKMTHEHYDAISNAIEEDDGESTKTSASDRSIDNTENEDDDDDEEDVVADLDEDEDDDDTNDLMMI